MIKKFLVTGAGGDLAMTVIGILRSEYPNVEIHGTDSNEYIVALDLIDEFHLIPNATDVKYIHALKKILIKEKFDYFIPLNDLELNVIANNFEAHLKDFLSDHGCKLIWDGVDSILSFQNKYTSSKILYKMHSDNPMYWSTKEINKISNFPVIVKPNLGSGSRGIRICNSKDEILSHIHDSEAFVIQEYISTPFNEYTVCVFRLNSTSMRTIIFRRKLSGGRTTWAEVVLNNEIRKRCESIAESISLLGSMNFQLRLDGSRVSIFEINPRFSSTLGMRYKLGFKDLIWSISEYIDISQTDIDLLAGTRLAKREKIVLI